MNKIYLGTLKEDAGTAADVEKIYLTKHEWSCGWYWSFGWIENKHCPFHFESLLYINDGKGSYKYLASDLFSDTKITDKDWWVIRDLFVQAYALKNAAEVYRYGGHQTIKPGLTDIIKNTDTAKQINKDLEKVLNTLWDFLVNVTNKS